MTRVAEWRSRCQRAKPRLLFDADDDRMTSSRDDATFRVERAPTMSSSSAAALSSAAATSTTPPRRRRRPLHRCHRRERAVAASSSSSSSSASERLSALLPSRRDPRGRVAQRGDLSMRARYGGRLRRRSDRDVVADVVAAPVRAVEAAMDDERGDARIHRHVADNRGRGHGRDADRRARGAGAGRRRGGGASRRLGYETS